MATARWYNSGTRCTASRSCVPQDTAHRPPCDRSPPARPRYPGREGDGPDPGSRFLPLMPAIRCCFPAILVLQSSTQPDGKDGRIVQSWLNLHDSLP